MPNRYNTPNKQALGKGVILREQNHPKNSFMNKSMVLRGLDLSKEILWVSLGQRAPKLQAVKLSFVITVPSHFF